MSGHDIIMIGASAGGVEALRTLVHALPAHFPASVFIVLHIPARKPSALPTLLCHAGPLRAFHPLDHALIERERIYVAPPDCHLLLEVGQVRLSTGPKVKGSRPAIDPLFRSAAYTYGPRVVGVILTGARDDGTAGLLAVKRSGDCSRPGLGPFPRDATQRIGVCHRRLYRATVPHCALVDPPCGF